MPAGGEEEKAINQLKGCCSGHDAGDNGEVGDNDKLDSCMLIWMRNQLQAFSST